MSAAPRRKAPPCPHCGAQASEYHLRDTGSLQSIPLGACPVLFAKRNGTAVDRRAQAITDAAPRRAGDRWMSP